jgi:hypothetical protein
LPRLVTDGPFEPRAASARANTTEVRGDPHRWRLQGRFVSFTSLRYSVGEGGPTLARSD